MFYKEGGLCWFIFAGATDESTKLMQYKMVVYIQFQERVEGYQKVFVSFETEGRFYNSAIKQRANIYDI